jgi:hypothetical protein
MKKEKEFSEKNATIEVKKSLLTDLDDFDSFYERDVFVTTINGTSNVEGKNFVYSRSMDYVTVIPNNGYNKFKIERRCNGEQVEYMFGDFIETELENGKKIMAIDLSFNKLRDGTHIDIYCLKG